MAMWGRPGQRMTFCRNKDRHSIVHQQLVTTVFKLIKQRNYGCFILYWNFLTNVLMKYFLQCITELLRIQYRTVVPMNEVCWL